LERLAARVTSRFVCVCRSEREAAVAAGLTAADRCAVIENGLPESAFVDAGDREALRRKWGLDPEDPVIGMAGRFEPQKGHGDLLRAAVRVLKRVPGVHFMVLGEGSLLPDVKRLIERAGVAPAFLMPGSVENAAEYYSVFDLVVLPSRWESLPYSLLEAMAAGKAIVATRVGGMAEAIEDGVSGLLVPPANPEALAAALIRLIESPRERQALGAAARKRAHGRYRLDDMVSKVAKLYEDLDGAFAQPVS
jgi:glycosyltransferase involved in cell wall biosynthesis